MSKVGEEQLFYLQSRGIDEQEATKMIVNGFVEPIVKELPMEYAVELNRLIELQLGGRRRLVDDAGMQYGSRAEAVEEYLRPSRGAGVAAAASPDRLAPL